MGSLVKLGQSPADFQFEVAYESGEAKGEGVLTLNFYELNAALVETGELYQEGQVLNKEYRDRIAKAARQTGRPPELVQKLTDAQLYAKANEMVMLFNKLGEPSGPPQTSRRPTESSVSGPTRTKQTSSPA